MANSFGFPVTYPLFEMHDTTNLSGINQSPAQSMKIRNLHVVRLVTEDVLFSERGSQIVLELNDGL